MFGLPPRSRRKSTHTTEPSNRQAYPRPRPANLLEHVPTWADQPLDLLSRVSQLTAPRVASRSACGTSGHGCALRPIELAEVFTDDVIRGLLANSLETAELGPDGFTDIAQVPARPRRSTSTGFRSPTTPRASPRTSHVFVTIRWFQDGSPSLDTCTT